MYAHVILAGVCRAWVAIVASTSKVEVAKWLIHAAKGSVAAIGRAGVSVATDGCGVGDFDTLASRAVADVCGAEVRSLIAENRPRLTPPFTVTERVLAQIGPGGASNIAFSAHRAPFHIFAVVSCAGSVIRAYSITSHTLAIKADLGTTRVGRVADDGVLGAYPIVNLTRLRRRNKLACGLFAWIVCLANRCE